MAFHQWLTSPKKPGDGALMGSDDDAVMAYTLPHGQLQQLPTRQRPFLAPQLKSHSHKVREYLQESNSRSKTDASQSVINERHDEHHLPTRPKKPAARDLKPRPPNLSATHPANYGPQPSQVKLAQSALRSSDTRTAPYPLPPAPKLPPTPAPSTPGSASSEPPWRVYNDPMWQTSQDPHHWDTNCTILRCDRALEPGNVISPCWMAGLPFGGMVERAYHYPSLERTQEE
ncbi:hypothetical protein BDY17DRAFT_306747 [Neohortaea acidophila]|uniref:Uncharacterized protein n=1 Tax=Neohortaea acidophila TaxID=245834 RepID=A0A6A6Q5P2_9PEZI|nr:uncharacterized protein BDY17DRAFT_306747 [Neohortaea acidophila]KAF2487359.1 hypothetical protein BDY17DRAFT_306747 [Neohortaea acidophila]